MNFSLKDGAESD